MADNNNVNLDDLPFDEYQRVMAEMEKAQAEQAKNAELGLESLPENDEHSSFDDFQAKNKAALFGEDDDTDTTKTSGVDDSVVEDQKDDPGTGDPEIVTEESNPDAYKAGQELQAQIDANNTAGSTGTVRDGLSNVTESVKKGATNTLSGAFSNFLGGIKGLFASGAMGVARTIASIGEKMGIPKAATYGLLFVLGGGSFAGIAALLGANNDSYKYGYVDDGCIPFTWTAHDNTTYKAPTQDELDGRAGALFNALNSDMHFQYAIRDGGTSVLENIQDDTVDDGYSYEYVQDPSERYDWNNDGVIDDRDDRSRTILGGYHDYDHTIEKFQDEQILGMIMAASAESNIDPSTYEMNYKVGTVESDANPSTGLLAHDSSKDHILSGTHHTQWNAYCKRMFAIYAEEGISINKDAYKYTDELGNSEYAAGADAYTDPSDLSNYYPGVGLWQWTGQRGYNLHFFANHLADGTDADGDGANDAMYTLNVQIAYLVEIEAKPVTVNGVEIPITEWGHEIEATYQTEYYVNVPNKPKIGTAPEEASNWIPMSDYQNPDDRNMTVPWDVAMTGQLRSAAKYKYESTTGARLSDKNHDDARDAVYFADSDKYDGSITAFDDAPFPVKDYVYNDDGSIYKEKAHKFITGSIQTGTEIVTDLETGEEEEVPIMTDVDAWDMNDDGSFDEDDDAYIDPDTGKLIWDGEHEGIDADGDGTIDVWDMNDNGEIESDSTPGEKRDWYIDHEAYHDSYGKESIFYPKEVYYQNTSIMVLATADGNYNASDYIYEDDSHCLRQYEDTTTVIDGSEEAKIVYQSPGITAIDVWTSKPWGDGSYVVAEYSESGGVSVEYKAIQKDDMWWDQLEAARKDHTEYGKETDDARDPFRETADAWRDEIWVWTQAHARGAVGRNMGLEFCLGWLGCPASSLESHTMFVLGGTSFAGRKDTTRYDMSADCIEHYAECMLSIDWHGSDTTGESITDLMYENMDTSHYWDIAQEEMKKCGTGDFDNSSIAACAVSWAWLKGHNQDADVNLATLDGTGCPKAYLCTSLYCAVHDIVLPGDPYYSSCDRGAATAVLASGSDDEFPAGNPETQFKHMNAHPEIWQDMGAASSAWGSMEPGDIICSTVSNPRHIIVFVGEEAVYEKWGTGVGDATNAIVHSSHSSNLSSSRGPRCDLDGTSAVTGDSSHQYHVFRCIADTSASSAKKAEVDAKASVLAPLNNGDGSGGSYYAPQY